MSHKLNLITKCVAGGVFVIQSSKGCLLCLFTVVLDSVQPSRFLTHGWEEHFFFGFMTSPFLFSPSCVTTSSQSPRLLPLFLSLPHSYCSSLPHPLSSHLLPSPCMSLAIQSNSSSFYADGSHTCPYIQPKFG